MASSSLKWINIILMILFSIFSSTTAYSSSSSSSSSSALNASRDRLTSLCQTTPYPDLCLDSLKLSISITISPNIITLVLQTLQNAISDAEKLSNLFSTAGGSNNNFVEKQRGALEDCKELHQITMSALQKSLPRIQSRKLADARAFLSAALTNKNTCLEGLESASGTLKSTLVDSILSTYKHVSNSLSMISKKSAGGSRHTRPNNRHLLGSRRRLAVPRWVARKHGRILDDDDDDEYDPSEVITVAADGSGNFTTITDAVNFAPNNSYDRIIISIKQGVYKENVFIPGNKPNIVMLGDESSVTLITGDRSFGDGWTTFRSATLAVSGEGFLARDITIENSAGPAKHQAAALRVNADLAAFYRCTFNGYQDTLYVHSFRQFYRECDISGTIDYIFGNAAAVLQGCNIKSRMPLPGQFTVITAHSRESLDETTGISIQNCSILATDELSSNSGTVKSYLGRPWRVYSTTVYLESYIDDFIDPSGWTPWTSANEGLDTLYYGEYDNNGPGSVTDSRVNWPGYHIMDYYDASNFTVSNFIEGNYWLESTSFPYQDGI